MKSAIRLAQLAVLGLLASVVLQPDPLRAATPRIASSIDSCLADDQGVVKNGWLGRLTSDQEDMVLKIVAGAKGN